MKSSRAKKVCDNVVDARDHGILVLLFNESYDDPLHHH